MVRAGQTAAAQTTGRQAEIPAILLHHDVAGDFGSAEERVLGLIYGKALWNAVRKLRVGVIPAPIQFLEGNSIRPIPINLVGGHVDEGRLRAIAAGGLEQVQRAYSVYIKVVEGN